MACNEGDAALPTVAAPAVPIEALPAARSLPPTNTPPRPATMNPQDDLAAIDTVLQEIDDQVCKEAHEARAEIEVLLQQGQDVADLAAAINELIDELEGCSFSLTTAPQ